MIGWQIDNELTLGSSPRCYCHFCQSGFQAWLRSKHGSLDTLNRSWGTVFCSQTYTDFGQISVPLPSGGDPNPGLALDYARYQSDANTSFLEEQLVTLRRTCPRHWGTTNNVGPPLNTIDLRRLYEKLDFTAFDNYPGFFEMLLHQEPKSGSISPDTIPTGIALGHDFARSIKGGKPYMVMEEQRERQGKALSLPNRGRDK